MFSKLVAICAVTAASLAWADGAQRDPTEPPGRAAGGPKATQIVGVPKLSSVLIGTDRRLAVVGGSLMSEGEERSGIKVWEIKPDRVVVSVAGQEPMTLMLDAGRIHKETR